MVADVDECEEKTHKCAQICQNTEPGFTCVCEAGYRMNEDHDCLGELLNIGRYHCKIDGMMR